MDSKLIFVILIITIASNPINSQLLKTDCPPEKDIEPCFCYKIDKSLPNIACPGNETINLKSIFEKIDNSENSAKHYEGLYLRNSAITELEEGAFGSITFGKVHIYDCHNLTRVHQNAFSPSGGTFELWIGNGMDKLSDQPSPYSIFDFLQPFYSIQTIDIRAGNIKEIPEKKFTNFTNLQTVWLNNTHITSLNGRPFFEIDNRDHQLSINIINSMVSHVGKDFFTFENKSVHNFAISLENNKLTGKSFEVGAFTNSKRGIHLHLERNQITYLDEKVFSPYLKDHTYNVIDLDHNPIDCNDCKNYWLLKEKAIGNWSTRVLNANCGGTKAGGIIWENENKFEHCKKM